MENRISAELIDSLNLVPSCLIVVSPSLSVIMVNDYAKNHCIINADRAHSTQLRNDSETILINEDWLADGRFLQMKGWFKDNFLDLTGNSAKADFQNLFLGSTYNTIVKGDQITAIIINLGLASASLHTYPTSDHEMAFQNMINDTEILISIVDKHGKTTFMNHAWEQFIGADMPLHERFKWEDAIHIDDLDPFPQHLYDAIRKRTVFSSELRMKDCYGA
ncbi:hypothetical protein [Pedobacter aquatilis]|uniref:hypothetical protein n=1 Tax=Pedobacter aquatilis TaxID=351343 RepID=UPI00293120A5|nr:hypothetical protein [Pedobacter aquatilis]